MDIAEYNSLPEIEDLDFNLQDSWVRVRLDHPQNEWVKWALGRIAADADRKVKKRLEAQLRELWSIFASQHDEYSRYLVRVPASTHEVVCWLRYGVNYAFDEKSELFSPENYEAYARKPDSERGAHVEIISVWRQTVPAGECVGQYATVHYTHLLTGASHVEERVSIAAFPTGAGQMLEFTFTTPFVGANTDHLVSLVQESMQSLTVKLAEPENGADAR